MNTTTLFGKRLVGTFVRGLALAGAMLVAPVTSADDFRIESRQGSVETVDYNTNRMVVGGVSYDVALDASVALGGSYGAVSMIMPGMKVEILIRRYIESGQREIIDVKELAPGIVPQEY